MTPAWLLKALSVVLTGVGLTGFSSYVAGHVKPPTAPLHPKVVEELVTVPAPEASQVPAPAAPGAQAEPTPQPTPVVIVKVVTVQVPGQGGGGQQQNNNASLSNWLNQTNVPQATNTYAS